MPSRETFAESDALKVVAEEVIAHLLEKFCN
jgi:hypothetical protein